MLKIERIVNGNIQENCYIVHNDRYSLIIDPGEDYETIVATIEKTATKPVAVLLTHAHFDHIASLQPIRDLYTIPVYVSPIEKEWLVNPELNLSAGSGNPIVAKAAEELFETGKTYTLGDISFHVVETPGHSPGSVTIVFEDFIVCGDALFKGSIGRTDLYLGSQEQLVQSICDNILTLPDILPAYPGHGDSTTIGHEKATNPFLK